MSSGPRSSNEPRAIDASAVLRAWALALAVVLGIVVFATCWSPDDTDVAVIAHRGASGMAPENTLAAIEAAIDAGADYVEIDVRLTGDGEPVLLHDKSLTRTTNAEEQLPDAAPWNVADLTLDEVRRLDAGSWKGAQFAGEPVPTLAAALDAVADRAGLLIELKVEGDPRALAAAVGYALDGAARANADVIVQSFDAGVLDAFEELQPEVPTALVVGEAVGVDQLASYGAREGITPRADMIDAAFVRAAQDSGLAVRPYTVNTVPEMRRLVEWRVDGIITDRPERLGRVLDEGGSRRSR